MNTPDLICPISNQRIDRNVVRMTGLLSTLCLLGYVATHSAWFAVPLGLDYAIRTSMTGPASPLQRVARGLAKLLRLPERPTDRAPKVFAARIGVCFAMGAAITHFVAPAAAPWLAGTLAVFATLESVFDFCFGCVVYTYVALPLRRLYDNAASTAKPEVGSSSGA